MIKEIDKKIKAIEKEITPIYIQRSKLDSKITKLNNKLKKLIEEKSKIIVNRKVNDWNYLLETNGNSSDMVKYNKMQQELRKLNLSSGHYNSQTNQRVIQITLYKNSDEYTEKTYKSIKKLSKYLKPVDNYITIDIFESSLSEGGIYDLKYNPKEDKAYIQFTRYHRSSEYTKLDTLKNTLKYIQKNLYYEENL